MSNEDRCLLTFRQTVKVPSFHQFSIDTQSAGKEWLGSAEGMASRFSTSGSCESKLKSYPVYMPFSLHFYIGKWMLPYWTMKIVPYLTKDGGEWKGAQSLRFPCNMDG